MGESSLRSRKPQSPPISPGARGAKESQSSRSRQAREAPRKRERAQNGPVVTAGINSQGPSTSKRGGDKRARILNAAVHVFAQKGFYATRVSEVARAAGVADGTIYLYFKSKDELLASLFEDRISHLLAYIQKDLPQCPTAGAKLRRIIELQLSLLEEEEDLAAVITIILRQSTKLLTEFVVPKFMAYLDSIAAVVLEGQSSGEFRQDVSPHLMARAVFGALDGIALTWTLGKADPGGLVRAAGPLATTLLRGLAPTPPVGECLSAPDEVLSSPHGAPHES